MAEVPQYARPFRIVGGREVVVEQDTTREIMDCVETVLRCPVGARDETPEFGTPDQVFREGGVDVDAVRSAVDRWEPRADATVSADEVIDLAQQVRVNLRGDADG